MAGWNAAMCEGCWYTLNPDRVPVRIKDARHETCSNCGLPTKSGIYVRVAPGNQNFPTAERVET